MARLKNRPNRGPPVVPSRINERAKKSGDHTALSDWTPAPLYRRPSVSGATEVAVAARARCAVAHLGGIPRIARCAWRSSSRPSPQTRALAESPGGASAAIADTAHALVDTHMMKVSYETLGSPCSAMPNVQVPRPRPFPVTPCETLHLPHVSESLS